MSKTFQLENVDQVAIVSLLQKTDYQMFCIEEKVFNQLPTVKLFFERFREDSTFKFHGVPIKYFEQAREVAEHTKDIGLTAVKNNVTARLGNAVIVPEKYSNMMLNTEGQFSSEEEDEFGIEGITAPNGIYRVPLKKGFSGSLQRLIEQWQSLCYYSINF